MCVQERERERKKERKRDSVCMFKREKEREIGRVNEVLFTRWQIFHKKLFRFGDPFKARPFQTGINTTNFRHRLDVKNRSQNRNINESLQRLFSSMQRPGINTKKIFLP